MKKQNKFAEKLTLELIEQEIKKHIKDFNKRIEEIRRGYEVGDKEDNPQ